MALLIALADEFSAELDANGMVHILDGENVVRLSMPRDVFELFIEDAMDRFLEMEE